MPDDMRMDLDMNPEALDDLMEEAAFGELDMEMGQQLDPGIVDQAREEMESGAMAGDLYGESGEVLDSAGYGVEQAGADVLDHGNGMGISEGEAIEQSAMEHVHEVEQIDDMARSEIESAVSELQGNDEIRGIHPYADFPQCPTCGTGKDESLEEEATDECAMCGRSFVQKDTWQSVEELELEQLFRYMGLRQFKGQ